MKRTLGKNATPADSSEHYMNAYERAHARAYMEQALALADWGIRTGDRIRAAIKRVRNAIGATFVNERRRRDDVVNYRGTH
jgi:hypothetical protein